MYYFHTVTLKAQEPKGSNSTPVMLNPESTGCPPEITSATAHFWYPKRPWVILLCAGAQISLGINSPEVVKIQYDLCSQGEAHSVRWEADGRHWWSGDLTHTCTVSSFNALSPLQNYTKLEAWEMAMTSKQQPWFSVHVETEKSFPFHSS